MRGPEQHDVVKPLRQPGAREARALPTFEARETTLHGHRVIYRIAGSGPPVVLIHGMLNSSRHWEGVARRLAVHHTVIAPDLLGHGDSAKPQGDYSLGAHAAGVRDLLSSLEIDSASIAGHSLGGGVAMQFFYQFPQRCERLLLVSSGGLGFDVSWPLRAAAVPGAEALLAVAASRPALASLRRAADVLRERGSAAAVYVDAGARALGSLDTTGARRGFLKTLRAVIDVRGQCVSAGDRLYLAGAVPTLVAWGARDRTIPVEHAHTAHAAIPGSRLEIIEGAAHFPHLERPAALADVIRDFLATTAPARVDHLAWRRLLQQRAAAPGARGVPIAATGGRRHARPQGGVRPGEA